MVKSGPVLCYRGSNKNIMMGEIVFLFVVILPSGLSDVQLKLET